jgi:hypothetical protein
LGTICLLEKNSGPQNAFTLTVYKCVFFLLMRF